MEDSFSHLFIGLGLDPNFFRKIEKNKINKQFNSKYKIWENLWISWARTHITAPKPIHFNI